MKFKEWLINEETNGFMNKFYSIFHALIKTKIISEESKELIITIGAFISRTLLHITPIALGVLGGLFGGVFGAISGFLTGGAAAVGQGLLYKNFLDKINETLDMIIKNKRTTPEDKQQAIEYKEKIKLTIDSLTNTAN